MKNLITDTEAILNPIFDAMISIVLIIILFIIGFPILYKIGDVTIALGSPAPIVFLYRNMQLMGFIIFSVSVFVLLLAKVYKRVRDTQEINIY